MSTGTNISVNSNVGSSALDNLNRINDIGFAEFTASLIREVFNSIISANMTQTQAYLDLVKQLESDLQTYINNNKNNISGADILGFLVRISPDTTDPLGTLIREDNTEVLTDEQANTLNTNLAINGVSININVANTTSAISEQYNTIVDAAANKLAANRYSVLQEMMKDGVVQLMINGGEIQSSLNFSMNESRFYEQNSAKYNRSEFNLGVQASSGDALAQWGSVSASTQFSRVGVSTVQLNSNVSSTTDVKIAGLVKLNFSTRYKGGTPTGTVSTGTTNPTGATGTTDETGATDATSTTDGTGATDGTDTMAPNTFVYRVMDNNIQGQTVFRKLP